MDSQAQIRREVKQAFVWFVIPFLSLIALGKIVWTSLDEKQIAGTDRFPFIILLVTCVACWLMTRKQYSSWLREALQGNSGAGKVLYSYSTQMFNFQPGSAAKIVLSLARIVFWILLTILALYLHQIPILILIYSGLIWIAALSIFMKSQWFLLGSQGLWITQMNVKVYVAYTAIKKASLEFKPRTRQVTLSIFFGGRSVFGENKYPVLLPQESADILKKYVSIDISQ